MKRGSGFSRWMKSHPATPRTHGGKLSDNLTQSRNAADEPLKLICPAPMRLGQDQYRCSTCGIVWSIDETRPPCKTTWNIQG